MIRSSILFPIAFLALPACAQAEPSAPAIDGAFLAAGFHKQGDQWHKCDDPGTMSYSPGQLQDVGDLNGDGFDEAVITEGSTFCYGGTETAFSLVSSSAQGWKLIFESSGIPVFQSAKGKDGWPDIEIGGPGFCFPLYRWNGKEYRQIGMQYDGKPCQ